MWKGATEGTMVRAYSRGDNNTCNYDDNQQSEGAYYRCHPEELDSVHAEFIINI